MFKAVHHTEAARTFQTYAEAYRFVMREAGANRLWAIVASSLEFIPACRAERDAFQKAA